MKSAGFVGPKPSNQQWVRRGGYGLLLLFLSLAGMRSEAQPTPLCFFSKVADRLIRQSTAHWCAKDFTGYTNTFGAAITNGFSFTNIPVLVNGAFVYSPAVNRLLQLSANIYDATTTNFYPTVFRPTFFRDANGNVFINGYEQVASVTGTSDPQLIVPVEVGTLLTGITTNMNIYGVPWILGAKKYLPNFNQFYMENVVQVTRRLQVSRKQVEAWTRNTATDFSTNEMFILSITNHVGYSLWNSYATNYPGGSPTIFVGDTMSMSLSNGLTTISSPAFFGFQTNVTTWPGAAWDVNLSPNFRTPAAASFIYGTGDFAFLPPSAYQFGTGTFVPLSQNPVFELATASLPLLPQLQLITTNWLYAYILGGSNVVDYVQFHNLGLVRNLNNELTDVFSGINTSPYEMWYTNTSPTGLNLGVANQISASIIGSSAVATGSGGWQAPASLPLGLAPTPQAEADYFKAFFTGGSFQENGQTFSNTNLINQAPYSPTRTMYSLTLWQANDPLVHSLSSDLNETNTYTGIHRTDDPTENPIVAVVQNGLGRGFSAIGDDRYQPWGVIDQLAELVGVDTNAYNLAYRDPLVYGSDDWNFPANGGSPINWIGQVHRGTPWQTVFLKSTNILDDNSFYSTGLRTWSVWTGDANPDDASWSAPVNDWRLASLVISLFNTNNLTSLLSVNNPDTNAWQVALNGLTALTNSTASPDWAQVPELDPLVIFSTSPQAAAMAAAIQTARANQPRQFFADTGDVLSTATLAEQSPFLNTADATHLEYSISDEAYEAVPSQLLPLLSADSIGSVGVNNGQVIVQFTGYDGHTYQTQVSSDLVHWSNLGTSQPVNATYTVTAPVLPGGGPQFYRSVLLP